MPFDVPTALAYARRGRLEEWVHAYLAGGEWANPGLAEGLRRQRRWWAGPAAVALGELVRVVGPEPDMEYRMQPAAWQARVGRLAAGLTDVLAVPPLIAEYRAGALSVRDGNHRLAAMQQKGWPQAWVVVWYNTEEDYRKHQFDGRDWPP